MNLWMDCPDPFDNDSVPRCLKCPICLDVPQNRVFQCGSGHTVCEECHSRLSICPQCRVPLGRGVPIRNLVVEEMLDEFKFDCPYKDNGCEEKVDRRTAQEHLHNCSGGSGTRREAANVTLASPENIVAGAAIAIATALPAINLTSSAAQAVSAPISRESTGLPLSTAPIHDRDENGNTQLHQAISNGEVGQVTHLISSLSGGDIINLRNNSLQTPLILAGNLCSRAPDKGDYLQMIKFLIDKGADIFAKDDRNMTFLHNVLGNFSFLDEPPPYYPLTPEEFHGMVEFLTDKEYKEVFDMKGWDDGGTPLQWAVQNLEVEERTLQLLNVYDVDFNAFNNYGQSVLEYALLGSNGSEGLITSLRKFGAM